MTTNDRGTSMEMDVLWLLKSLFYCDNALTQDRVEFVRPILADYLYTTLDPKAYQLFVYIYTSDKPTLANAASVLGMSIEEAERVFMSGVGVLRFNLSTNEGLLTFVIDECPEFATNHVRQIRREYEHICRMLVDRLGAGALSQHNSVGPMLIGDKTKELLRANGLDRVLAGCFNEAELTEEFGLPPDVARRILSATVRQ